MAEKFCQTNYSYTAALDTRETRTLTFYQEYLAALNNRSEKINFSFSIVSRDKTHTRIF